MEQYGDQMENENGGVDVSRGYWEYTANGRLLAVMSNILWQISLFFRFFWFDIKIVDIYRTKKRQIGLCDLL